MRSEKWINRVGADGKVTRKVLVPIAENMHGYKTLGAGSGSDFNHCLYLGSRYCTNFLDRVVAYRNISGEELGKKAVGVPAIIFAITVEFFEKE